MGVELHDRVFVINQNVDEYEDDCEGIHYVFPVGKAVVVPLVAAEHIFGYGLDEAWKRRLLVRAGRSVRLDVDKVSGKAKYVDLVNEGMAWLGKFEIREAEAVVAPTKLEKQAAKAKAEAKDAFADVKPGGEGKSFKVTA